MVKYIEFGDIFNIDDVLNYAHGCNCAGAMGKGIAVQFRERFPEMYKQYKKLCREGGFTLGDIFEYNYGYGYVFNLGTQLTWRTKADINALEKSLTNMLRFASKEKIKSIALPKIGAGLGGLDWDNVKSIINKVVIDYPEIQLFVIENYNPTSASMQ